MSDDEIPDDAYEVPIYNRIEDERTTMPVMPSEDAGILETAHKACAETNGDIVVDEPRLTDFAWYDPADHEVDEEVEPVSDPSSAPDCGVDPGDILQANAELYREKNADYGSAWRLAGQTMALWSQELDIYDIDPQDPRQMVDLNLFIQRLHKLIRAFNLSAGARDPNNEAIAESHRDSSTYAAIHASHALEREMEDQDE